MHILNYKVMKKANNEVGISAKEVGIDNKSSNSNLVSHASLAAMESLTMPLVHEIVISADLRCSECQKRIKSILTRFNAVTESVVVNLVEKKVVVTCKYPSTPRRSFFSKVALIKRLFRSSKP